MNFIEIQEKWATFSFGKKAVIIICGIIIAMVLYTFSKSFLSYSLMGVGQGGSMSVPPIYNKGGMVGYSADSYRESSYYTPPSAYPAPAVTDKVDAEKYELSSYNATIKTRHLDDNCASVQALKKDSSVIFLSVNSAKTYCTFSFKVEKAGLQKVLDILKGMDPDSLNENVETIAATLATYDRRKEILETQLTVVDATLKNAIASYEELSSLAVKSRDANSLATAINNKIDIIDRLSTKKLSIEEQLRSMSLSSSDSKAETGFVHFNVSVTKDTYIDGEAIATSWKYATQTLLNKINTLLQELSLGFISVMLTLLKYVLYLLVFVALLKYVKRAVIWIWTDSTKEK